VSTAPATRDHALAASGVCAVRLILNAIDYFRPTLMMVDNVPLGMKGELRPALRHLAASTHTAASI